MTDTTTNGLPGNAIIEEHIDDALSSRYLAYALSTITMRALPDVRDGLKPVHRRILYACLLYTSPSPRDQRGSRMPSSA